MLEAYLEILDLDYFEVKEAFGGLADENVWKRPAEGLLSVGELAGHIAYWEAMRLAGEGQEVSLMGEGQEAETEPTRCKVSSPLVDPRFRYYTATLGTPPSEQHLAMTAEQVCSELLRVHEEAVAHFKALNPDPDSPLPGWPGGWTHGASLKYLVFHVAYHTGQMYSVRHLLGEETPDN
jgi:hypothetical protein